MPFLPFLFVTRRVLQSHGGGVIAFLSSSQKKSKSTHSICPEFLVQLLTLFLLAPPSLYNKVLLFRLFWLRCLSLREGSFFLCCCLQRPPSLAGVLVEWERRKELGASCRGEGRGGDGGCPWIGSIRGIWELLEMPDLRFQSWSMETDYILTRSPGDLYAHYCLRSSARKLMVNKVLSYKPFIWRGRGNWGFEVTYHWRSLGWN